MAEEHKGTIWSQILVAVAVAILVGTTAPWWWAELRDIVTGGESRGPTGLSPPGPDTSAHSSAFDRANAVQSLYNRGKAAPCPLLYQIIDGIAVYNGDSAPLPTDLAQTVFSRSQRRSQPCRTWQRIGLQGSGMGGRIASYEPDDCPARG